MRPDPRRGRRAEQRRRLSSGRGSTGRLPPFRRPIASIRGRKPSTDSPSHRRTASRRAPATFAASSVPCCAREKGLSDCPRRKRPFRADCLPHRAPSRTNNTCPYKHGTRPPRNIDRPKNQEFAEKLRGAPARSSDRGSKKRRTRLRGSSRTYSKSRPTNRPARTGRGYAPRRSERPPAKRSRPAHTNCRTTAMRTAIPENQVSSYQKKSRLNLNIRSASICFYSEISKRSSPQEILHPTIYKIFNGQIRIKKKLPAKSGNVRAATPGCKRPFTIYLLSSNDSERRNRG